MQIPMLVLTLTGAMLLTGCSKVTSLNAFVTEHEATMDPGLIGVWQDKDGENIYVVKQDGNAYAITYMDGSSRYRLEARLLDAGEMKILDITAKDASPCQIPVHMPLRVRIDGAALRLSYLDTDWIRQQAARSLGAQEAGGRTVIGAPGEAVRRFLVKYGADSRSQGEEQMLFKMH